MSEREFIEPIKNGKDLRQFEKELLKHGQRPQEIYLAWQIGKRCLLRISDVLGLATTKTFTTNRNRIRNGHKKRFTVRHMPVFNHNGTPKQSTVIYDIKTGKENVLDLNPLQSLLTNYYNWLIAKKIHSKWLFPSATNNSKPLNRRVVGRLYKLSANELGLSNINTHSARKSGAYLLYKHTHNLAMVQDMLNHSSQKTTLLYLGLRGLSRRNALDNNDWED